ncbi:hypothetical protein AGABI2DRAFT_113621 [Agaricus bisporus var. bisporus H97]|uniref:hypothetical protein n=1 Tax=Agaricus bisporus var. bisporus (strain H97 / ATCC MYA-4626 / FGSC 10389) TaxID=936046 RepID=UPI00029F5176|nr:hypothetical protein AGABI2DRAFT_113621 [Agaricus bisporus var. bisporus H97]EKV50871.1 hypothetical protein AGABI2DRAFT_113621 [Agaricus bisporus var. bisporus H97]
MQNYNPRYPPSFAYRSAPSVDHRSEDGRLSARSRISQHPPTLPRNVPLPSSRLSPLFDRDDPLPPVPFTRLDDNLQLGEYRRLPSRRSQDPGNTAPEELFNSATFPETGEFRLVVNIRGRKHEVRLRPKSGATAVLVSDVVAAVEWELESAANQWSTGLLYNGHSASRGSDGLWSWYGLAGAKDIDEQGLWILYL